MNNILIDIGWVFVKYVTVPIIVGGLIVFGIFKLIEKKNVPK